MNAENVPIDTHTIMRKLLRTWTKLTDSDVAHYVEGRRSVFLNILEHKYAFTREQAETALGNIERQSRATD